MPIYEYESEGFDCLICGGRFEVLQQIQDGALQYCPTCGLEVRRVISRASIVTGSRPNAEKAAQRGFTTWKRTKKATWEKVAGPGVDAIVGTDVDVAQVESEQKKPRTLDLDTPSDT